MRSTLRATTIALVFSVVASVAQAQAAATKIAYINSQALMEAAPGRAAAESLLAKTGQGFRTTLDKMQDSARTMLANYQKDEPTLTPPPRKRSRRPFRRSRTRCSRSSRPSSSSSTPGRPS